MNGFFLFFARVGNTAFNEGNHCSEEQMKKIIQKLKGELKKMSEAVENKTVENEKEEATAMEVIEVKEGIGKKVLKWGLRALALLASGIAGALIGRAIGGGDDGEDGENSDSETSESENEAE